MSSGLSKLCDLGKLISLRLNETNNHAPLISQHCFKIKIMHRKYLVTHSKSLINICCYFYYPCTTLEARLQEVCMPTQAALRHCNSKCGLRTGIIHVTWELLEMQNFEPYSRSTHCNLSRFQVGPDCCGSVD